MQLILQWCVTASKTLIVGWNPIRVKRYLCIESTVNKILGRYVKLPPFVRWCVALNNEWGLYYVMQGYGQKVGPNTRREEIEGYSDEQHRKALELYEETKPKNHNDSGISGT